MRLALRTLLAFEDNVFDVEQHRRLEQLLPTDKNAETTLQRIRSVVRNPSLGVPGLIDRQEELDPNYVAEYLDHQMSNEVQSKFEAYCLSADKYLAEIASVHHILSNVLGEPARTSRECRLKCYDVLTTGNKNSPMADTKKSMFSGFEQPKHFRPYDMPQESNVTKPETNRSFVPFWNLLFPSKAGHQPAGQPMPTEQKSPIWTFTLIGLFICALLLGWQQIEKQRLAQQLREIAGIEMPAAEGFITANNVQNNTDENNTDWNMFYGGQQSEVAETSIRPAPVDTLAPLAPIEQVTYTSEMNVPEKDALAAATPAKDPFAAVAEVPPMEVAGFKPFKPEDTASANLPNNPIPTKILARTDITDNGTTKSIESREPIESRELPVELGNESIIAFQPIVASTRSSSEVPIRQNTRSPVPASMEQSHEAPVASAPASGASAQYPLPPPIMQTSGGRTPSRVLGRAIPTSVPGLIFSAVPSTELWESWQLPSMPFDLNGMQYLLTAAPFRGTFELAAGFRIEMIGDAKLCILPPDPSGVPGLFVDYGRIVIHPLKPNQPLRIETERSCGIVSVAGTNSILFIDTFAEIFESPNSTKPIEGQKPKTGPILGVVPKNGEIVIWKSAGQPQPLYIDSQGSVLLQSEQYRLGEVRLPKWIGTMPVTQEDRLLAEVCQRYFADARGHGEQALSQLIQNDSPAVRALGFRLWGDLGRFDIPLTVMAEKRHGEEAIRQVLVHYFDEVMRRDAETVQRFADDIETIKEARRN